MLPTVRTAGSVGAISRATTACSRITIIAASTTGSTDACGMEPCAPRPCTVIRMLSAADSVEPGRVPTTPAGIGSTCWPNATSTAPTTSASRSSSLVRAPSAPDPAPQPVLEHRPGTVAELLGGLEQGDHPALPVVRGAGQEGGGA